MPQNTQNDGNMQARHTRQSARGERRQLTVMSCDLVNSVELSTRYDPEDLAEIVSEFQSCCERIVRRFEGYVARFTGDGLKAYFGYPRAEEYNAERAIQAAMALVAAVRELKVRPNLELSTRVGIATGDVVVGEIIGIGEAQERTVAGKTPNLAARLEALGQPDSVTISDTTKQLVGRLFEYEDLGKNTVKGFPDPIQAWRVLREGPTSSHFEALRAGPIVSPFVGREHDLDFLRHRWLQVRAGKGQSILLSGEAGVGKSRLSMEFRSTLIGDSFWDLRHYCSPYHQNSAFYPVIKQLQRSAGLVPGDSSHVRLSKLEAALSESDSTPPDILPLLAELLSIPGNTADDIYGATPAQRKQRILQALETGLVGLATTAPVLLLFEDLHWMDPSTGELLERLTKRISNLPIMLLMTTRPDRVHTWEQQAGVTFRSLTRLPRNQSEIIVGALDPESALSRKALEQILDYSDGLPLFVEELTKTAVAAQIEQDRNRGFSPEPAVRIPRTLQDSLLARLDRLGPWKLVAQTAAVIGRSFSYELLAALFPDDEKAILQESVHGLVHAGLIIERGIPPEATYTFTHALFQEAASACLLNAHRRAIHERIARTLESDFPETASAEPELLALHYTGAGIIGSAIDYWQRAAELALQRSANLEAAHHLGQALELLNTTTHSEKRDIRELSLLTRLGATLTTIKGFAAPEVESAYERARTLCHTSGDAEQRFSVLRGLWIYDFVRAEWSAADELATTMLSLGRQQRNSGYEVEGHRALGMAALWRGDFERAREHFGRGLRLYDPEQHSTHAVHYGNDPGIACLVHEAFALWVLGYPDRALAACRMAIVLARRLAHPFSLAQALVYSLFIHGCRGEAETVRNLAHQVTILAKENGFPFWQAEATIMQGWALAALGEGDGGISKLRSGIADFFATGARMDKPRWFALLAEAYGSINQTQNGLHACTQGLTVAAESKEHFFQARLYQIKGELLLREGAAHALSRAESFFGDALAVARQQRAKSWELRAATSLARLWYAQRKRCEARQLLAPVYAWFTEGFDTADLRDAKVLLDHLA